MELTSEIPSAGRAKGTRRKGSKVPRTTLPDGLEALRVEMELGDVMRLIERTARWVDPATFQLLPLWYPEYARKGLFYKSNWSAQQLNKGAHKQEGNVGANKALTHALGLRSDDRPNWSCCHIWGVDDARYQSAMLRICARALYGWHCDHESLSQTVATIDRWGDWAAYPASWPRAIGETKVPPGVVALDDGIRKDAARRLARIRKDLVDAGPHYPKEPVRQAMAYWKIEV